MIFVAFVKHLIMSEAKKHTFCLSAGVWMLERIYENNLKAYLIIM